MPSWLWKAWGDPERALPPEGFDMPVQPIIDAHLHVWDIKRIRYPWLRQNPFLDRSFLLEEYRKACGPLDIEKMVFLQCECDPQQYREEVAWVTGLAESEDGRIRGIVAWAPLEKGAAVRPEIEALAANKLVKGVRRIIEFEEDMAFCLRPDFIKGVNMLPEYGLAFDIGISHRHLRNTIRFVDQCPDVRFILDHIGKPNIREGVLDPWRDEMRELAKFPNVICKVSSLATEADHKNWKIDQIRPFSDHVFEVFGFDRTVFAGDWPVSTQAADLACCVETLEQLVQGISKDEHKKLFHDNAEVFYRI
jgi:L-fuconolactonase